MFGGSLLAIVIEYIIVFILIFIFSYFLFIKRKQRLNRNKVPIELNYLIRLYKINVKNIKYKKFVWIYNIINTFIITTIYIIIVYLVDGLFLQLAIGAVLLILLTIICYGLLGRYYQKKGEKKCTNIKK